MKIKIIISLFIFIFSAWDSGAAEKANLNWVDNSTKPIAQFKYMSSGCMKLSCYEDLYSLGAQSTWNIATLYVQPLTMNTTTINRILDAYLTDNYSTWGYDYNYLTGVTSAGFMDGHTSATGCPWDSNYTNTVYTKNGVPFGGHSSAMQGLLWSWRMVSNKWQGVWASKSYSEYGRTEAIARQTLPNPANGKHIVIVSDGIDNDGPDHLPARQRMVVTNPKDAATSTYIDDNGEKILPIIDYYGNTTMPIGVCDAHKPFRSIKPQDYTNVCNKLKEQNIKVHVLFTGFEGDNDNANLRNCANITGGKYINLTVNSATEVTAALDQVFAAVKVSTPTQVKLEEPPEGF